MENKKQENKQSHQFNFILQRLNQYENYFHVLGLIFNENKREYYTSEIEEQKINQQVKELYDSKIKQLNKLLEGCENLPEYEKIKENFKEKFYDAYNALKDRNSRINYIKLLDELDFDR